MPSRHELKLAVLGLGHVGLPTALGLAELGWWVVGAEDDKEKAAQIARGEVPFHEPGVADLLRRHLQSERFTVRTDVGQAVREANVVFVCVGTPQREDGGADLSQLDGVARSIARNLNGYKLIVEKSTTPVLTAQQLRQSIARYSNTADDTADQTSPDDRIDVAVNPEFLREGRAVRDFFNPDRIVIGAETDRAAETMTRLYQPLLDRLGKTAESFIIVTDVNTAEIIKHASNAFLSTKISFINMVADLCEATEANVQDVARGLGMDPRIGPSFLNAGIGFGGFCLPKDLSAFRWIARQHAVDFSLLAEVAGVNEARTDRFLEKVRKAVWVLKGKTLAVWGLSFKPDTDDVREAPSIPIVRRLVEEGARLRLYDPQAAGTFKQVMAPEPPGLVYSDSPEEAADGADALLILTEWPEFARTDLGAVKKTMAVPVIVDGRNMLDPEAVRALGFEYHSFGRP